MSLITQCPACSTMFRVVPDQLRISEGWVRCGNCDEVFDANAHLGTLDASAEPVAQQVKQEAVQPEAVHASEPEPQYAHAAEGAPTQQEDDDYNYDLGAAWDNPRLVDPGLLAPIELAEPEPRADAVDHGVPDGQDLEPVADLHVFEPAPAALHDAPEAAGSEPSAEPAAMADEVPAEEPPAFEPTTAESISPSFMQAAAKPARRWLSNGMAAALCSLLLLALVVQVARQERDRIAASAPALRPILVAGCEWMNCSVAPLREIESIAIDSSAFTSVRPGVYLLGVTLKNTATTELAMPALELTLTDMQDEPVLRKVLLANDWSGKPVTEPMAAGAERTAKLPISVPPDVVPRKIAGYKLLAFYP